MAQSLVSMSSEQRQTTPTHPYNFRAREVQCLPAAPVSGRDLRSLGHLDVSQDEVKGQLKRKEVVKYSMEGNKDEISHGNKRGLAVGVEEKENLPNRVNFKLRKVLDIHVTNKNGELKIVEPPVPNALDLNDIMVTSLDGIREMIPWTQLSSEQWESIQVFLETRALCLESLAAYHEAESTWFWGNKVTSAAYHYAVNQYRHLVYQKSIFDEQYGSICELLLWRRSINVVISRVHFDPLGKELDVPSWKMQAAVCLPMSIMISRSIIKELQSDIVKMTQRFENLKVMACPVHYKILRDYRLQLLLFRMKMENG